MEVFVLAASAAGEQDGALLVHHLMKMYATGSNVVPEMASELLWVGFFNISKNLQRGDGSAYCKIPDYTPAAELPLLLPSASSIAQTMSGSASSISQTMCDSAFPR